MSPSRECFAVLVGLEANGQPATVKSLCSLVRSLRHFSHWFCRNGSVTARIMIHQDILHTLALSVDQYAVWLCPSGLTYRITKSLTDCGDIERAIVSRIDRLQPVPSVSARPSNSPSFAWAKEAADNELRGHWQTGNCHFGPLRSQGRE
jgi:hypothetical protein